MRRIVFARRTKIDPRHCRRFQGIQGGLLSRIPSAARGNATESAEFPS